VEVLFPSVEPVVVVFPYLFWAMVVWVVFFLVLFSFFWFWPEDSSQVVQFGEWPASCVVDGVHWSDFLRFFLKF
jgi:hypothetical protein